MGKVSKISVHTRVKDLWLVDFEHYFIQLYTHLRLLVLLLDQVYYFLCHFIPYHKISESHRFCNRVQDAYTLRCCPQVHGIVHDTIDFVRGVITTEMNSATDNPVMK